MTLAQFVIAHSAEPPALVAAVEWLQGTLLGSVAIGLCVIAVAWVGLLMLQGRLPVREGARVILGCFILLGAPVIASGFLGLLQGGVTSPPQAPLAIELPVREELPPPDHDPYAGASLRSN